MMPADFRQMMNSQPFSRLFCIRVQLAAAISAALLTALGLSDAAEGKTPEVSITSESELHFGTFMVFGSGSRTVTAGGAVIDGSIVALEGAAPMPARFSVTYDRGSGNNHVLDIELELVISNPPGVREGGVEGSVSGFQTDLPGASQVAPGQAIRLFLRNCRSRTCSRNFHVGGRLDVTRHFGGADLAIPITMDATVISVERLR